MTLVLPEQPANQNEITKYWEYNDCVYVSFVCLCFNHEKFLETTLNGLLAQQTKYRFEIIIHDDVSTDSSRDILKNYRSKYPDIIKLILQKENQFSQGKRITPIATSYASGKYIAMCEGDDFWLDVNKIQKQVAFLESNNDYVISFHDVIIVDENNQLVSSSKIPKKFQKSYNESEMALGDSFLPTLSWVYRNIDFGDYQEINKVLNGDTFFVSMLSSFGKAKYHSEIKAAYRLHHQGAWSTKQQAIKVDQLINTFFWMTYYHTKMKTNHAKSLRLKHLKLSFGAVYRQYGLSSMLSLFLKSIKSKLVKKAS